MNPKTASELVRVIRLVISHLYDALAEFERGNTKAGLAAFERAGHALQDAAAKIVVSEVDA